ncbi:MAG: hypothetical protein HYY93_07310 [Planctomycetes bacterium]|nr:hypothetical protein [Planctomycetota bacterium]
MQKTAYGFGTSVPHRRQREVNVSPHVGQCICSERPTVKYEHRGQME